MRESGVEVDGHVLVPFLRESTILALDDGYVPTIRRSALALETEREALQT
jgi:hypothetical protein